LPLPNTVDVNLVTFAGDDFDFGMIDLDSDVEIFREIVWEEHCTRSPDSMRGEADQVANPPT